MRTSGDDIAEVLALLGVMPMWDDASRRVVGLEAIDLSELGRPRTDVTVRISGFFRDAVGIACCSWEKRLRGQGPHQTVPDTGNLGQCIT